jgi:hypothetical protein
MNRKWLNFCYDMAFLVIVAVIITLFMWLVSSCSPRVITVPEYHYERHNTTDTITLRDSVLREQKTVIREADSSMLADLGIRLQQGERAILVLRKELERALSQQKEMKHDTVVQRDSIRVPYPIEKQLTRWESLKLKAGGYLLAVLIVAVLWFLIVWLRNQGTIFRRPRDGL